MSDTKTTNSRPFSGVNSVLWTSQAEQRRSDNSLKNVGQVQLTKWVGDNGKSSFKIKIFVTDVGYPTESIKLDPSNVQLRKSIEQAYKEYDKLGL